MQRGTERILSTHVGSRARPVTLLEQMREREHGGPCDVEGFGKRVRSAVADVVRKQVRTGPLSQ